MASDYPPTIVALGFYIQNQSAGTQKERDAFGEELFDAYDAHIVAAWARIAPTETQSRHSRALQAVMALNSAGGSLRAQALAAVRAFQVIRGV
jgi:hypothetical protein